ncbi:MAG: hypothetical protein GY835_09330, partial [bacterium]|nr:hypothetical protein [bacterium]
EENPDPELRKEEIKLAIVEMDGRLKMQIEGMRQDTEMMKIGVNQDMNAEKLNAMLMDNQKKRESEERKFFAEIGVKERFGNGI